MRRFVVPLVLTLLATPAMAHDYWLAPVTHVLPSDGDVGVSLLVGDRLVVEEDRPFEGERTPRIDLLHGPQTIDLRPDALERAVPFLTIPLHGIGGHLLVVDRMPATVAAKFDTYIHTFANPGIAIAAWAAWTDVGLPEPPPTTAAARPSVDADARRPRRCSQIRRSS